MNDIPKFEDAIASFRGFLAEHGHPANIFWVFREDIWKRSPTNVFLRFPSKTKNLALAKTVFEKARRKGLVDIHAIAIVGDKVATTIWFPKFKEEEIQGWESGMKMSFPSPLPTAQIVGQLRWLWFGLKPQFRNYQRVEPWVGTKAWAVK